MFRLILVAILALSCIACSSQPLPPVTPSSTATNTPSPSATVVPQVDKKVFEDFAPFYASYKQLLVTTGSNDLLKSRDAMTKTLKAWTSFYKQYKDMIPPTFANSVHWSEQILRMNTSINEANKLVHAKKLTEAHDRVEMVSIAWFTLRKENNYTEYADTLFSFHTVLEAVLSATSKDIFAEKSAEVQIFAQSLENNPPQDLSDTDKKEFTEMSKTLRTAVEETTTTIQQGLTFEECLKKAQMIKEAYMKLFLRFG